ncbi:hypothetical protein Bhyg_04800, partial [Pseudolycoriella hygida]
MEKCKQLTVLVLLTFSITINSGRGVSVKHPELPEYQLDTNYSLIPPFANVYSVQNWIFRESSTTNDQNTNWTLTIHSYHHSQMFTQCKTGFFVNRQQQTVIGSH